MHLDSMVQREDDDEEISVCWKSKDVDRSEYGHEQDTLSLVQIVFDATELPSVACDPVCRQASSKRS